MAQFDGTEKRDEITGTDVADVIYGLGGNDRLDGGAGDDVIEGGFGRDTIYGGDGDDRLSTNGSVYDPVGGVLYGGDGNDTIEGVGTAELPSIAHGDAGNDYLFFSQYGKLYGDAGDDYFENRSAKGLIDGGEGNDQAIVGLDDALANVGSTIDLSSYWRTLTITIGELTIRDIESLELTFTNNDDVVTLGERPRRAFAATVHMGGGNDHAIGSTGDDRIFGGNGDDLIEGGAGNDNIEGGDFGTQSGRDTIYGGDGDDSIGLILGRSRNAIIFGEAGNDSIAGSNYNDLIDGGHGDDELNGRVGRDRLTGGDGADLIYDGDQRDIIIGGAGIDTMYSFSDDSGNRFVFADGDTGNTEQTSDIIIGFKTGANHDTIDLRKIDANLATSGDDAFSFIGMSAFSGNAGELRFEFVAGDVFVSGDADGDGAGDFYIQLLGVQEDLDIVDFRL